MELEQKLPYVVLSSLSILLNTKTNIVINLKKFNWVNKSNSLLLTADSVSLIYSLGLEPTFSACFIALDNLCEVFLMLCNYSFYINNVWVFKSFWLIHNFFWLFYLFFVFLFYQCLIVFFSITRIRCCSINFFASNNKSSFQVFHWIITVVLRTAVSFITLFKGKALISLEVFTLLYIWKHKNNVL